MDLITLSKLSASCSTCFWSVFGCETAVCGSVLAGVNAKGAEQLGTRPLRRETAWRGECDAGVDAGCDGVDTM